MIVTCKKRVPFRWIAFAILPWASFTLNGQVVAVAFFFSLKKFVENPAGLTFILSLPALLAILLQPTASFISDRIWTRFGRRKPFIVTSQIGIFCCLILFPLMPNFWALLAVFILYNVFADLNSPMEPLKQEIIPPHERGRATGAMSWCSNLATMTFYFVALGRFDDVRYMAGVPLVGETAIYWSAAVFLTAMILLIMLGIREVDQKSALRGQRLSIRNFIGGLLDRELWPVYMLVVGAACLNFYAGLGPLSNLLYTEQWGYTKQEMGINVAVGGIINLFAIGILTVFADKLNRMRAYQTLIVLSLTAQIAYYFYIHFVLPDRRPSLVEIIVFGEMISILGILTGLVYVPLVYDYIRRNKMGTYNAGATLVNRLTTLITLNGVGLFVWAYALLFQPPGGEMTRVVLQGEQTHKTEVRSLLKNADWTGLESRMSFDPANLHADAWQATGMVADTGRCWEVRFRNPESEKLAAEKERLNKENSPLVADEKMTQDNAEILRRNGKVEAAAREDKKRAQQNARIIVLTARINEIDRQLAARAEDFHARVLKAFGNRLITEGDQVIGATTRPALLIEIPVTRRPDSHSLEKSLNDLRRERRGLIDIRPFKRPDGYGIVVSTILEPGVDEALLARDVQSAAERVLARRDPGLVVPGTAAAGRGKEVALTLDLMVVEEPLDTYVSPITRVVNLVLALFDRVPTPDRRLSATARSLRIPAESNHVRADPGPGPKTISVTALLPSSASKAAVIDDPVSLRILSLLGEEQRESLPQVRNFYDRIEKAAAIQRFTVAHPSIASSYAPIKYDYMSGYIWMFVMGSIGICITIAFVRFEAKGLIQKRGVEEAAAS